MCVVHACTCPSVLFINNHNSILSGVVVVVYVPRYKKRPFLFKDHPFFPELPLIRDKLLSPLRCYELLSGWVMHNGYNFLFYFYFVFNAASTWKMFEKPESLWVQGMGQWSQKNAVVPRSRVNKAKTDGKRLQRTFWVDLTAGCLATTDHVWGLNEKGTCHRRETRSGMLDVSKESNW